MNQKSISQHPLSLLSKLAFLLWEFEPNRTHRRFSVDRMFTEQSVPKRKKSITFANSGTDGNSGIIREKPWLPSLRVNVSVCSGKCFIFSLSTSSYLKKGWKAPAWYQRVRSCSSGFPKNPPTSAPDEELNMDYIYFLPTKTFPATESDRIIGAAILRCPQSAVLSPVQMAAVLWVPTKPDLKNFVK